MYKCTPSQFVTVGVAIWEEAGVRRGKEERKRHLHIYAHIFGAINLSAAL